MAVRPLVNLERLTTAHVNSVDGSMTYESGTEYKANTTVSYNGSLYTANVDIEDTDTDTPDAAPDKWSMTINAPDSQTSGDISALAARVTALEDTVGDDTDGLVKDVSDLQDNVSGITDNLRDNVNVNGCKNRWNIEEAHPTGGNIGGTATYSDGTITVNCPATYNSGAYLSGASLSAYFSDLNGIPIILSYKIKGDSSFTASVGDTTSPKTLNLTTSYQYDEILFNGAENIKTLLFYSLDDSTQHTITITDFMCRLATNKDSTYVPYAMSNGELTDILDYKKLADSNYGATVADTWEYSGISVTLDKPALIAVNYSYDNTRTKGIAVCTGTDSVTTAKMSIEDSVEGSHQLVGILPAGTYYVWVKASGVSSNNIKVYKLMTLESNPF